MIPDPRVYVTLFAPCRFASCWVAAGGGRAGVGRQCAARDAAGATVRGDRQRRSVATETLVAIRVGSPSPTFFSFASSPPHRASVHQSGCGSCTSTIGSAKRRVSTPSPASRPAPPAPPPSTSTSTAGTTPCSSPRFSTRTTTGATAAPPPPPPPVPLPMCRHPEAVAVVPAAVTSR